jgi:hypothetical protein
MELVDQETNKTTRLDEKTFRIPVSTGIFEHCPHILDSVWLFLWYIDKTTSESNGEGSILGGMPIADSKPAAVLKVPVKTVRSWRLRLERNGYIRTRRTPYGHVITLLNSMKWPAKSAQREFPKREISPRNAQREFPKWEERIPETGIENSPNGKYKEDKTVTLQRQDREREAKIAPPPVSEEQTRTVMDTTNRVKLEFAGLDIPWTSKTEAIVRKWAALTDGKMIIQALRSLSNSIPEGERQPGLYVRDNLDGKIAWQIAACERDRNTQVKMDAESLRMQAEVAQRLAEIAVEELESEEFFRELATP